MIFGVNADTDTQSEIALELHLSDSIYEQTREQRKILLKQCLSNTRPTSCSCSTYCQNSRRMRRLGNRRDGRVVASIRAIRTDLHRRLVGAVLRERSKRVRRVQSVPPTLLVWGCAQWFPVSGSRCRGESFGCLVSDDSGVSEK